MGFIKKNSSELLSLWCSYNIDWFDVESIKGKLCNTLTDADEELMIKEIKGEK